MFRGWIKWFRSSVDNRLYLAEPFDKWHAWEDLVLTATYQPRSVIVRGVTVELDRGEVLASEEYLARRWQWSRGKVRRFLNYLSQKTVQQIVQRKNNVCTVIAICNYEEYQGDGTADRFTDGQQTDIPKNSKKIRSKEIDTITQANQSIINNTIPCVSDETPERKSESDTEKRARKKFVPPTLDKLKAYIEEAKLEHIDPEAFIDYFTSNGWKVGGKGPMKDWKAAARNWNRNHKRWDSGGRSGKPISDRRKTELQHKAKIFGGKNW